MLLGRVTVVFDNAEANMVHQHRSLMASFAILAVMGVGCCGCGGCGGDTRTVAERQQESDELWKTDKPKAVAAYKETYGGFWTSNAEKTRILPRIVEFEVRAGNIDEASEWVQRGIKHKLDVEYKDPASLKVVAAVEKANEEARVEAERVKEEEAKVRAAKAEAEAKQKAEDDEEDAKILAKRRAKGLAEGLEAMTKLRDEARTWASQFADKIEANGELTRAERKALPAYAGAEYAKDLISKGIDSDAATLAGTIRAQELEKELERRREAKKKSDK